MKINKDNVIGFVAAVLVLLLCYWGYRTETRVRELQRVHNNVVALMNQSGLIQAVERQNAMRRQQAVQPLPRTVPAPKPAAIEEK